jgi:hypothetical protein
MKKKFLAVNVALALGAMSGVAAAAVSLPVPDATVTALNTAVSTTAVAPGNVVVADNHIGTINVVPYYSVQNGNTVALTITNNDQLNGKVVKVRFRGAQWSDDVLDFQVFLSPSDVWTAAITKDASGVAKILKPADKTCTLPLEFYNPNRPDVVDGAPFIADVRLAKDNPDGTLEGYVEIITVADIPPKINGGATVNDTAATGVIANPLYAITKHSSSGGAPACRTEKAAADALEGLAEDNYWTYGYTTSTATGANNNGAETNGKEGAGVELVTNRGLHTYNNNDLVYWSENDGTTFHGVQQSGGSSYTVSNVTYNQFGEDKNKLSDDWLQFPTSGISTFVTIVNVENLKAYTLQATALKNSVAFNSAAATLTRTLATSGDDNQGVGAVKAYFQQRGESTDLVSWLGKGERATADKIFGQNPATGAAYAPGVTRGLGGYGGVPLLQWDLPDLSTPTTRQVANLTFPASAATSAGVVTNSAYPGGPASAQRDLVANVLQAPGFAFDYVTEKIIEASTDVVVNQPVRRYFYWYDKLGDNATSFHREFVSPEGKFNIYGEINTPYEVLSGAPIPTAEGTKFGGYITLDGYSFTGREEEYVAGGSGSVGFSPAPPAAASNVGLYGEVSVISVNTTSGPSGALGAELTNNRVPTGGYQNGWGYIKTTVKGNALTPTKFIPNATGPNAFALNAHWLLVGGSVNGENLEAGATHTAPHTHALQLPFIAYTTVNVYSPASNPRQAYGTTLPVRKGPQIK